MRSLHGHNTARFTPIIGAFTRTEHPFHDRRGRIRLAAQTGIATLGYAALLSPHSLHGCCQPPAVQLTDDPAQLSEGDILRLEDDGTIDVVWERQSTQNALLLTEACNCHCLMCPQPPRPHDPQLEVQAHTILDLLRGSLVPDICLTGGEPTLLKDRFLKLLERCVREHPEAHITLLTNGKNFADPGFTRETARCAAGKLVACVSLHSDLEVLHDTLVGRAGSARQTQQGIYQLAQQGIAVELRHVITRLNHTRLPDFAEHVYNYMPFCIHYAFMGLELCGHAAEHADMLSVSPLDYAQSLSQAVIRLHRRGLHVSVYNLPLCQCAPEIRIFARQSISGWKNTFLPQCADCSRRQDCAGLFATSVRQAAAVTPLS